jgi:hypothetical protein
LPQNRLCRDADLLDAAGGGDRPGGTDQTTPSFLRCLFFLLEECPNAARQGLAFFALLPHARSDGEVAMARTRQAVQASSTQGVLADPKRAVQRRMWIVERIGWVLLALALVWAVLGGTGHGPLSNASVQAGPVDILYQRFSRKGVLTPLELRWKAPPTQTLELSFDARFIDRMKIDFDSRGLSPRRSGDRLILILGPGSGSLLLEAHPSEMGMVETEVALGGQAGARLSTFVFP